MEHSSDHCWKQSYYSEGRNSSRLNKAGSVEWKIPNVSCLSLRYLQLFTVRIGQEWFPEIHKASQTALSGGGHVSENKFSKGWFQESQLPSRKDSKEKRKSREGCETDRRSGSPLVGSTAHEHKTLVAKLGKGEGCNVTDSNRNIPYCEEVHIPH